MPPEAIAIAAHELTRLRDRWLNPPEWTAIVTEVVPGFPDRVVPIAGHEIDLKTRTLTHLYNKMPPWLANANAKLDAAVAAAYGWADYTATMPDAEILTRLLALNSERSALGTSEVEDDEVGTPPVADELANSFPP